MKEDILNKMKQNPKQDNEVKVEFIGIQYN